MKLAIVGHGRAGKDTVCDWLAANTTLRYWGSCSRVILPHAADRLRVTEAEAWATRHEHREVWRALGDELRANDPGALARAVLSRGDICCGVRSLGEIGVIHREGLADLVVWVDRAVPIDPTLEFGRDRADVVLPNHGTLPDLYRRLRRLSRAWGILWSESDPVTAGDHRVRTSEGFTPVKRGTFDNRP